MKWTYIIQKKFRVALLLGGIMFLITLFAIIEQKNVASMSRSVISIYNDRLIPATDMFYISEHMYAKEVLIENHLRHQKGAASLRDSLDHHNMIINNLIIKFEQTNLVIEETNYLDQLKSQLLRARQFEDQLLMLMNENSMEEAKALFASNGRSAMQGTLTQLAKLTRIQTEEGKALLEDSKKRLAVTDLISNFQMIMAIIIGILIISLVFASRVSSQTQKKYNWN